MKAAAGAPAVVSFTSETTGLYWHIFKDGKEIECGRVADDDVNEVIASLSNTQTEPEESK